MDKREGGDLIRCWVEFNGALTSKMSPGRLRVSAFDPLQKLQRKSQEIEKAEESLLFGDLLGHPTTNQVSHRGCSLPSVDQFLPYL